MKNDDPGAGVPLVRALLAHGADPNARVTKGTPVRRWSHDFAFLERWIGATPLWLAARFLELDMIRVLAAAGADVHLTARDGTTPLMAAAGTGYSRASGTEAFLKDSARFLVGTTPSRSPSPRESLPKRSGSSSTRCGRSSSWARTSIVRTPPATRPCTPPPRSG